MHDAAIRSALRATLEAEHANEEALVLDELGLCRGRARVDMAVVTGALNGYEIKGDYDRAAHTGMGAGVPVLTPPAGAGPRRTVAGLIVSNHHTGAPCCSGVSGPVHTASSLIAAVVGRALESAAPRASGCRSRSGESIARRPGAFRSR